MGNLCFKTFYAIHLNTPWLNRLKNKNVSWAGRKFQQLRKWTAPVRTCLEWLMSTPGFWYPLWTPEHLHSCAQTHTWVNTYIYTIKNKSLKSCCCQTVVAQHQCVLCGWQRCLSVKRLQKGKSLFVVGYFDRTLTLLRLTDKVKPWIRGRSQWLANRNWS